MTATHTLQPSFPRSVVSPFFSLSPFIYSNPPTVPLSIRLPIPSYLLPSFHRAPCSCTLPNSPTSTLSSLTLTLHSSNCHTHLLTLTPYTPHSLSHSLLTLLTHSSHTPHPHTPHTDTENVFPLMVWVLDDRQKKQLHPFTPSHRPTLTQQSWSGYGQSFILQ